MKVRMREEAAASSVLLKIYLNNELSHTTSVNNTSA
jgi:hypothetical protein